MPRTTAERPLSARAFLAFVAFSSLNSSMHEQLISPLSPRISSPCIENALAVEMTSLSPFSTHPRVEKQSFIIFPFILTLYEKIIPPFFFFVNHFENLKGTLCKSCAGFAFVDKKNTFQRRENIL